MDTTPPTHSQGRGTEKRCALQTSIGRTSTAQIASLGKKACHLALALQPLGSTPRVKDRTRLDLDACRWNSTCSLHLPYPVENWYVYNVPPNVGACIIFPHAFDWWSFDIFSARHFGPNSSPLRHCKEAEPISSARRTYDNDDYAVADNCHPLVTPAVGARSLFIWKADESATTILRLGLDSVVLYHNLTISPCIQPHSGDPPACCYSEVGVGSLAGNRQKFLFFVYLNQQ